MKLRVGAMVGQIVEGMPWLGTFHSIGVKILRRHAELVGLKPDFSILDTDDQIRLLKQLLEAADVDEKRWPARVLAGLIDSWKNRGLIPDQVPAGEARGVRRRQGQEALCGLPGTAEGPERGRLRRPSSGMYPALPDASRRSSPVPGALPVHPGRRVSGHQRRAVSLAAAAGTERAPAIARPHPANSVTLSPCGRGCRASAASEPGEGFALRRRAPSAGALRAPPSPARGEGTSPASRRKPMRAQCQPQPPGEKHLLRRRRRPVDLRLARRGGRQHPALRARFSRREDHPPGAQLSQHRAHPRRRLASHRSQRGPARQDAAHRGRAGREGAGHLVLGLGGRGARDRRGDRAASARQLQRRLRPGESKRPARTRSTRSPSWCAPRSRCASSRTASSRSACPIG